jgi:phytoene/squalene synthetase
MADATSVEFDHCRELALLPGSVFEFTSRFLPTGKLESLLALYALRQSVGTIAHSPVDDSVKWAKLKWWSEEFIAEPDASSRHPVLRALWLSGARAHLANPLLLRLVGDALSEMDMVPDGDENSLFERQAALGATEILLELALDDAEIDTRSLDFLGAATGSFRLISSFSANRLSEATRLPLSLLAKYNVSAQLLERGQHKTELTYIIVQLAESALDWYSKGMSGLSIDRKGPASAHLQLRLAMESRRLNVIRQDARGFLEAGKNFGPADAWFAWRFVRKLR